MKTHTYLLNRAETAISADGHVWMHVCPFGEHPWYRYDDEDESKVVETIIQVIDREACQAMEKSYPLDGPSARIDIDHKSMDPANTTEASGWGKFAEMREDGLWVKAEPTSFGAPLIKGKVYLFNSPCFPRDGLVHLGGDRYRVTKLGVIALTNDPNLRGQTPLTNRRAQSANPNTKTKMDYKAELTKLLGLPPEASDEQIANGCAAYKTNGETMNSRLAELQTQLVNRDLDEHGITDAAQRTLLTPMLANKDQRPAALMLIGRIKTASAAPQTPLHNRAGAPVPKTDKQLSGDGSDPDQAASNLHNRAMAYKHANRTTYETALAAVRSQTAG